MHKDYLSPKWLERRDEILERDNFTCTKCKIFNPSLGAVKLIDDHGKLEIHRIIKENYRNIYQIDSQSAGCSVIIMYSGIRLLTPVLQVHHNKYHQGKAIWESPDEDLETLCKSCHIEAHKRAIPTFNNGQLYSETNINTIEEDQNDNNDISYLGRPYLSFTTFSLTTITGNVLDEKGFALLRKMIKHFAPEFEKRSDKSKWSFDTYEQYYYLLSVENFEENISLKHSDMKKINFCIYNKSQLTGFILQSLIETSRSFFIFPEQSSLSQYHYIEKRIEHYLWKDLNRYSIEL